MDGLIEDTDALIRPTGPVAEHGELEGGLVGREREDPACAAREEAGGVLGGEGRCQHHEEEDRDAGERSR